MNNQNIFWKLPQMEYLELQNATYRNHTFTTHFHENYAIGAFLRGSQEKFYRRSRQILSQGAISVINPGEVHSGRPIDRNGWSYRMLFPDASFLQQIATQITEKEQDYPFFPNLVIDDRKIFKMILDLHQILEPSETSLLKKESALIFAMEQLILKYADISGKSISIKSASKHIKRVREFIDENYDQEISLEVLSKLAELSPYYLLRLFKKEVGATPHLYLSQRRINKAKQFLASGDSLSEVAYKTGFSDQSHFTHRFRNMVGITPGLYHSKVS